MPGIVVARLTPKAAANSIRINRMTSLLSDGCPKRAGGLRPIKRLAIGISTVVISKGSPIAVLVGRGDAIASISPA